MAEKGLGRGLGALFGEAALESDAVDCVLLPLSKVETGLKQPRYNFNEDSLAELADSISLHGVIQPLTVRKLSSGYYQIIAGERRWRAARIAGLDRIPVRIVDADDRTAMELALVENLQREDLNPIEEARGYRSLMDEFGFTQEKAAERVGKSRPVITNALRLLSLPNEVIDLLENGSISPGHGRALLSLKEHSLQLRLALQIVAEGLSVRQTELLARKLNSAKNSETQQHKRSDLALYIQDLEQRLTSDLGRKVKISSNGKKGRLELEYYNNEDLEILIHALTVAMNPKGGDDI